MTISAAASGSGDRHRKVVAVEQVDEHVLRGLDAIVPMFTTAQR
jgi:hypothetical protein